MPGLSSPARSLRPVDLEGKKRPQQTIPGTRVLARDAEIFSYARPASFGTLQHLSAAWLQGNGPSEASGDRTIAFGAQQAWYRAKMFALLSAARKER